MVKYVILIIVRQEATQPVTCPVCCLNVKFKTGMILLLCST